MSQHNFLFTMEISLLLMALSECISVTIKKLRRFWALAQIHFYEYLLISILFGNQKFIDFYKINCCGNEFFF